MASLLRQGRVPLPQGGFERHLRAGIGRAAVGHAHGVGVEWGALGEVVGVGHGSSRAGSDATGLDRDIIRANPRVPVDPIDKRRRDASFEL